MSAWTYYSPLWLGVLLAVVMNDTIQGQAQVSSPVGGWLVVLGVGIMIGLGCQLLLIGAQGAFAQVLPVPIGRSIRGRGATVGGALLVASVALCAATWLLASEEFRLASRISGGVGLASAIGVIVTYVWCWPVAVRDFDARLG